ncbi:MAG: hypothetical protein ACI4JA_06350 [Oscillospiraceae bacterium]
MKTKRILIFAAAVLMLSASGCQKAPEEVVKENSILDNTEKAESAEPEYQTLDEIRKAGADALTTNTTNVTVDKLIIGNGDVMPAYKVSPYNNDFDLLKPLVKYLYNEEFLVDSPYCEYHIGGQKYDESDPQSDVNPHSFLMYAGENMDFTRSLIYHETGYSFYNAVSDDDPYRFTEYFPTEKRYRVNLGEQLDSQSYTMLDGSEWSVMDCAEFAQNFVDEYFAPLEKDLFTYQMTDFRVKKLDDSFGYVVEFQRVDKSGNLYDNHYYYANDDDFSKDSTNNWIAQKVPYLYSSQIQVTMNSKDTINSFIKCNAPYTGDVIDSGEKLLTLSSAIDIISMNMAGKSSYSFETVELEYYYVGLDCPDITSSQGNFDQENMLNNADVELRPYWAFTMSDCYPDVNSFDSTVVYQNSLYLVDAITGDFYVY